MTLPVTRSRIRRFSHPLVDISFWTVERGEGEGRTGESLPSIEDVVTVASPAGLVVPLSFLSVRWEER